MRAFHFAWFTFYIAFTSWFALAPLTPVIIESLQSKLDEQYICTDDACSFVLGGTLVLTDCNRAHMGESEVYVASGGYGPFKNLTPSGYYPTGQDNRNDQTGEKCESIRNRVKPQLWWANIASVSSTIVMRCIIGPLCDILGPRVLQSTVLALCAIPTFCAMAINNWTELAAIRAFIGIAGATFVTTQFWTMLMFSNSIIGVASGTTAGWGNLGGGIAQIFMVGVFEMFQACGYSDDTSWRLSMIIPGLLMLMAGTAAFFFTDDCPRGDYSEARNMTQNGFTGGKGEPVCLKACTRSFLNLNMWILSVQYAACFGVELHMNNSIAFYFYEGNDEASGPNELPMTTAGIVASLFGLTNLFARSSGGATSDFLNNRMGVRGRILTLWLFMLAEGIALVGFSRMNDLASAIALMVIFSIFVQACEGATYALVPYVDPAATGTVSGVVGSGGSLGALSWGLLFLYVDADMSDLYMYLGFIVLGISCLNAGLRIPGGASSICNGQEAATGSEQVADDAPTLQQLHEPVTMEGDHPGSLGIDLHNKVTEESNEPHEECGCYI